MLTAMSVAPGDQNGLPFQGPSLWPRVIPFASVAVLAEASLALPPGPNSAGAVLASVLLLLVTAAAFRLPWSRLPEWAPAVVPLLYVGSVLALLLAAGSTSGVGIVILMPLIWTALFHRRTDSVCVVVAIVAVEIIVSLVPVAAPAGVIARRAIFWTSLGALISVATHGLRDSIQRSQVRTAQLQSRLRELTVLADRDRIAADLRDKVIQRIFAAGLTLQSAASQTAERDVRTKIGTTVAELDQTVRMLRDAIFGLEQRPDEQRGLRQRIMDLVADLSPAPEISFTGPVDTALAAAAQDELIGRLSTVLSPDGHQAPTRVSIMVDGNNCRAVIETSPGEDPVTWSIPASS
jgi:signal transduction histidine kinase